MSPGLRRSHSVTGGTEQGLGGKRTRGLGAFWPGTALRGREPPSTLQLEPAAGAGGARGSVIHRWALTGRHGVATMRFESATALCLALLLALVLSAGCASSGGGEAEDTSSTSDDFDSGLGDGGALGEGSGMAVDELETIYFDYDRATIRDDQKPTLRQNAAAIRNGSWRTIVIEGNTDERGSEEYNLALGERRANSVRQYLTDSGVSSAKLDTVSFGEAKPAVQGHDESAWRWNRRADFRVIP